MDLAPSLITPFGDYFVDVKLCVTRQRIAELLSCAFEGGSSYWIDRVTRIPYELPEDETKPWKLVLDPPTCITVQGDEYDPPKDYILGETSIWQGLILLSNDESLRDHLSDFLNDNEDANTGDVFLQLCLFGEIIYG